MSLNISTNSAAYRAGTELSPKSDSPTEVF